ncbi:glycosyltransferase [Cylindrospermopsis raciborskii]|uniref:glycosyltransferase n=1 Tax=Cylindrospermopsis raciborskii TaxID=77022 RepID=UPI0022BD5106|nr:glycosyltransferase [Cylindrospermopsis raciborskii]MCZ2207581.1 glycosyltransferase [Cylindrospermopsis raciborskii PAMP2011]
MISNQKVIFVGNARDYHTMDVCRAIYKHLPENSWVFLTDCIESEGHIRIIHDKDNVKSLFIIDSFLFRDQSIRGDLYRNIIKLLLSPIQAMLLKIYVGKSDAKIIHAHTFYYGLLCRLAGLSFLFTPQGGELTERVNKSVIYKFLMQWTLSGARYTFVDSRCMLDMAYVLGCERVSIYQYGVDTTSCQKSDLGFERWRVVSNRGIAENYRISLIQSARDRECSDLALTFFYPLWEIQYRENFRKKLRLNDEDLGRINKNYCYQLYAESLFVVSIPVRDSSPRSVYEAIFCGSPVVTVHSGWVEDLPLSMRRRILLVDPESQNWFREALNWSRDCISEPFIPCENAISKFDQFSVASELVKRFYLS